VRKLEIRNFEFRKNNMKAEIITIGDEILIGQIIDTNSAWMGEQLNLHGIEIFQITSVHDDHEHILKALSNAEKHADLVLITGGLGPTKDDITKKVLCEYFDSEMVINQEVLQRVTDRLTKRNVVMNQLNKDQALVPDKCTVLTNSTGTAPGMWFEKNDTIFVSMPGVPFEMKSIMSEEVLPRLSKNGKARSIYHQTVLVYGIPESMLAEKLEEWEAALPDFIKLAYLPSQLMIRLRLSAYGKEMELLKKEVHQQIELLKPLIAENFFGYNADSLAGVTGQLLTSAKLTLGIAESCTGGNIAHMFTANPGSSSYFKGGIIAYSNEVKQHLLKVSADDLERYGAVSKEVALQMAQGVQQALDTDYAIATTGIAGPDGGTDEKPVGTVWIAVISKQNIKLERYTFAHNRERNILRSSQAAIDLLRKLILFENPHLA